VTEVTHLDRIKAALVDRYVLTRELGAGGMATVYLAHDVKHDRKVAVKVLKPELAAMIGGERFLTEIKTTANLQHPHILPLFDSGSADSFLYYVMPYIEGESLRGRLNRERQLGVEESLRITRDVADALDYAHRQGVIHRDIKPENILLHDGRPVVADFGIALAISAAGGGRMTETGLSLGTPHYMSPEQATADRDLSPRSDVYSLACVLYEMLSGDPPHTGPSAQAILVRILTENPRSVSEARSAVPPHVAAVLAKALEKLPADRFESAKAFGEALSDESFTYIARTPGRGTAAIPAQPPTTRGKRTRFIEAALVVLLAGAAAWGWLRPEPEEMASRFDLSLGGLEPNINADVIISPDGSMIALAAGTGAEQAIYLRRVGELNFQKVLGTDGAQQASFSPDNQWIVFRKTDNTLVKVAVTGGGAMTLLSGGEINPFSPHWGKDDNIVITGPQGVYLIPASGGEPKRLENVGGTRPFLLPDGSGVLHTGSGGGGVSVLDFETDSSIVLIPNAQHPSYVETGHLLYVAEDGGLFAVPFDLGRHRVTGPAVRVLDRVAATFVRRGYSVSRAGVLVHHEGAGTLAAGPALATKLLIMDLDGGTDTVPLPTGRRMNPRFSPDGRFIAYEMVDQSRNGETDIYTFDRVTGTNTQITFEGDNDDPVWSPDGTRILFDKDVDGAGEELHIKPVDNSTAEELVLTMPGDQVPTAWLDDDTVMFESYSGGGGTGDLYTYSLKDNGEPKPYLEAPWVERGGQVSPDRTLAALVSTETGVAEIWLRTWPVPEGKWRISFGGFNSRAPRWSPDGQFVYFWRRGTPIDTLYRARVDRNPGVVVRGAEQVLTIVTENLEFWDIHPDGRHLITTVRAGAAPTQASAVAAAPQVDRYLVVLNWFTELRALTARGAR